MQFKGGGQGKSREHDICAHMKAIREQGLQVPGGGQRLGTGKSQCKHPGGTMHVPGSSRGHCSWTGRFQQEIRLER